MGENKELGFFKYVFKTNTFLLPALAVVNIVVAYLAYIDISSYGFAENWAYVLLPILDIFIFIWLIFDWQIQGKGKDLE